jgi:hypothetical protein
VWGVVAVVYVDLLAEVPPHLICCCCFYVRLQSLLTLPVVATKLNACCTICYVTNNVVLSAVAFQHQSNGRCPAGRVAKAWQGASTCFAQLNQHAHIFTKYRIISSYVSLASAARFAGAAGCAAIPPASLQLCGE